MFQAFFEDLEIPKPDYFLESGPGTHSEQTAKVVVEFEKVCKTEKPECTLVFGDVNSTRACSIVAKKMMIRVGHVDDRESSNRIAGALNSISKSIPIVFAVHPRIKKMLEKFNIKLSQRIYKTPPLGY